MLIPKIFLGLNKDVKKETKKIARKLRKDGASLADIIKGDLVDVSNTEHLILFEEPTVGVIQKENIYIIHLWEEILPTTLLSAEQLNKLFYQAIQSSWGVLSLFCGSMSLTQNIFFKDIKKHRPFIEAVLKYWPEYLKLGTRFSFGTQQVLNAWSIFSNLHIVLALNGLPQDLLRKKLPSGGLQELIKQTTLF